ncbi:hypothetical protein ACOSQ4_012513 [Xanthoceras sorbifolium]
MAKILNLRQQLQTIKKGSHSVSDFVLKIKNIGDALSAAGEEVSERDLLLSLMHGVGHEYDAVVVLISSQRSTMSLEEAQFLLLMHEQRIEELNSPNNFGGPAANYAANNTRGGNPGGFNRSGSRGYSLNHKGYCCLHPSGKVFITRHAEFNEVDFPYMQLFSSATASSSNAVSSMPIHSIVDLITPIQQSQHASSENSWGSINSTPDQHQPVAASDFSSINADPITETAAQPSGPPLSQINVHPMPSFLGILLTLQVMFHPLFVAMAARLFFFWYMLMIYF